VHNRYTKSLISESCSPKALQFGHNVAGEYARFYIPIIYICKNMLLSFDGQEMALVVNEKHVVPFQAKR
jgi:hypothetical protein